MDEVETKRRRLNDYTGVEEDLDPAEKQTAEDFDRRFSDRGSVNGEVFPWCPVQFSPEQHARNVRTMPMSENDVIIASYPSSGARWVWEMAQMLVSGRAEPHPRPMESAVIELNPPADLTTLPPPRVLSSHLFLRQLSRELVTRRSRVVHVMRNPKDLVVSRYFRCRQQTLFEDRGFPEFAVDFLNGSGCQGTCLDYFTYLHEMTAWQRDNPEVPLLNIFYEDIYQNPVQCVHELARFLQLGHVTDALCGDVADECAFGRLKEAHASDKVGGLPPPSRILFRDYSPCFLRNGEVGDWKNHFTMALSEHFDAVLDERLGHDDVTFQYSVD